MTFNINWDKEGVYVKFRGLVTAQDLIDSNNYLMSNAKFDSINYQIFDFLDIEEFKVSSYDISIIGTMNKSQSEYNKDMMIAIISEDNNVKEIIKEYDQLLFGTNWISKGFSSVENARTWVNKK